MTREEAEARARAMPRIKALVDFRNSVVDKEWTGIDIITKDGKAGVGNPEAIAVARKAMLELLDRQIEAESKESGDAVS